MPGLSALVGGWVHRDLRGMSVCMNVGGGPLGGLWGVGGRGGAPRLGTQESIEKVSFPTDVKFASALRPLSLPT
jgi:hypothetical protein